MSVKELVEISHYFGSNPDLVLAGGGNTSCKEDGSLYVKGSGTTLATITEEGFVKMDRAALAAMWTKTYSSDSALREEEVLEDLMDARVRSDRNKRPSVETSLHDILPQKYVVHLHPALVNGITCSQDGAKAVEELWGDRVVWVNETEPGWTLAVEVKKLYDANVARTGKNPMAILLQNHGIFVAGDTFEEIKATYQKIFDDIRARLTRTPDFSPVEYDEERASYLAPEIRMLLREGEGTAIVTAENNAEFARLLASEEAFAPVNGAYTPDHIVYYKPYPLFVAYAEDLEAQQGLIEKGLADYKTAHGYLPRIVAVQNTAVFAFGTTKKNADTSLALFRDAAKIAAYAESFGGHRFLSDHLVRFIETWEVEKYRSKVSTDKNAKRLAEKIIVVTGAAQGFGQGIADSLLEHGCNLVIADLNEELSQKNAREICERYGAGKAIAVKVDVGSEESVHNLLTKTVLAYGGIDLFVSNAGIARSGNLEQVTQQSLEFHIKVNYSGFFLCSKYASRIMKIQHRYDADYMMDIVQVNSKSGLQGSNKNFAYAGSKFGGIGLVESFALELVEYNIKVNAVCPGNYLDGPLWSDPVKGLFVQYLNSGKVPGAKYVDDVRKYYESKVPMSRGCLPSDVAVAVMYCMEQPYETGQAIPVTGGQVMLK